MNKQLNLTSGTVAVDAATVVNPRDSTYTRRVYLSVTDPSGHTVSIRTDRQDVERLISVLQESLR